MEKLPRGGRGWSVVVGCTTCRFHWVDQHGKNRLVRQFVAKKVPSREWAVDIAPCSPWALSGLCAGHSLPTREGRTTEIQCPPRACRCLLWYQERIATGGEPNDVERLITGPVYAALLERIPCGHASLDSRITSFRVRPFDAKPA